MSKRESVSIQGGQVESAEEFWKTAAEKMGLPSEVSSSSSTKSSAGLRYVVKVDREEVATEQVKYFSTAKQAVLSTCKQLNTCLVVDDFHYMSSEIQKAIIRSFKSEIFEGLDVILIAVPHRAFDAIAAEPEMQGRFVHIEIPSWKELELQQIARRGFPELHIQAAETDISEFAAEAHGSPILMQRFCNNACRAIGVTETVNPWMDLDISKADKERIYSQVAENFGFPTYKVLADGPQTRTDRSPRKLRKSSKTVDIYEAVLLAIASTGPRDATKYDDIRDALRNTLVESDLPQKQQITNTLNYMVREAKEKLKGEPPIEWKDDVLYITDPMLQFYLRWMAR
ncbi:hypothetical protein [Paracoccus sp. SJTW-4]|uniref:hypothetical protein n=1 Tax=Paracoccus sp. SJTW-4 TaxID=3078428 RepID=UPI0039EAC0AB